jgi:hypothetical protein
MPAIETLIAPAPIPEVEPMPVKQAVSSDSNNQSQATIERTWPQSEPEIRVTVPSTPVPAAFSAPAAIVPPAFTAPAPATPVPPAFTAPAPVTITPAMAAPAAVDGKTEETTLAASTLIAARSDAASDNNGKPAEDSADHSA